MGINFIRLALLGFLSGAVSYYLTFTPLFQIWDFWRIYVMAGIVFGITVASYFVLIKKVAILKSLHWIFVSVVSYWVAVATTLFLPWGTLFKGLGENGLSLILFFAGLVGSFLMLVGIKLFIYPLTSKQTFILTLLGGILGLSWYVIPEGLLFGQTNDWGPPNERFFGLFAFWQMGMAAALGWIVDRDNKNFLNRTTS